MPSMKSLFAQQAKTEQEFETARDLAETLANQENEALIDDETYVSWTRRKKLAEREVVRLETAIAAVADEIEAENGRQERDALQKRYAAVKMRNEEVQARLRKYGTEGVAELLTLLRDLAQDELDVGGINGQVPYDEQLRSADRAVRCTPSVPATEEILYWQPARDFDPLWKTIYLPPLVSGRASYNGKDAWAPHIAIGNINRLLGE